MDKIYAVVSPSSYPTPGLAALSDMFVDLYHHFSYHSVNGYSLGKDVSFFDSIEDATEFLFPRARQSKWNWLQRYNSRDAILELEVEDSVVKSITAIHKTDGANHWRERTSGDVSAEALDALSEVLKSRYVSPHRIDLTSTHTKAQLCRQLSTQFKKFNIEPEKPESLSMKECLTFLGGEASVFMGMIGLLEPKARPAALLLCALGVYATKSAFNRINDYHDFENNKKAFIRHNLFGSAPSRSDSPLSSPEVSPRLSH